MASPHMRYDAFISYSQQDAREVGPKVQRALHRLAKPWYALRACRVFLDQSELSAGPDVWAYIEEAMDQSRHLVLLASPKAAQSPWVNREVERWLKTHSAATIVVVLVAGTLAWRNGTQTEAADFDWEATNAVPGALSGAFSAEPLWVDLRPSVKSSAMELEATSFYHACARIASKVRGVELDALVSNDHSQQRRVRILLSCAAVFFAGLALAVALLAYRENRAKQLAEQRTKEASQAKELAEQRTREVSRANQKSSGLLATALVGNGGAEHEALLHALDGIASARRDGRVPPSELVRGLRAGVMDGRWKLVLEGHQDRVGGVNFSASGAYIVSASVDQTARVWDAGTGKQRFVLQHADKVWSATFANGDRTILTSAKDGTYVWDAENGLLVKRVPGQMRLPSRFSISPDGQTFVTAGEDVVRVFRMADAELVVELPHSRHVHTAAFTHDQTLTTASDDGWIRVWDYGSKKVIRKLRSAASVMSAAFEARKGILVGLAGLDDYVLQAWSADGTIIAGPQYALHAIDNVALAPDSASLAIADWTHQLSIWNLVERRETAREPDVSGRELLSVAYSPGGKLIGVVGEQGVARIFSSYDLSELARLAGHEPTAGVNAIAFSPDGTRVVTGADDRVVRLWNVFQAPLAVSVTSGCREPSAVTFADGASLLVVGCKTGEIRFVGLRGATRTISGDSEVLLVRSLPNGRVVAVRASGEIVYAGDASETIRRFPITTVRAAVSADGVWLGAIATDGVIYGTKVKGGDVQRIGRVDDAAKMLDFRMLNSGEGAALEASGRFILTARGSGALCADPDASPWSGRISRDATRVLVTSSSGVTMWDTSNAQHIERLWHHEGDQRAWEFAPDDQTFVGNGHLHHLATLDATTGELLDELEAESGMIAAAEFSSSGSMVALVGSNDIITVLPSATEGMARLGCLLVEPAHADGLTLPCASPTDASQLHELFLAPRPNPELRRLPQ